MNHRIISFESFCLAIKPEIIEAIKKSALKRLLVALLCSASSLHAATLTVNTAADSGAGSLRAMIAAASDGDTIQFDAALNGQTITLTSAELVIDKNITINGPGPSLLAVSRSSLARTFRIFRVTLGHVATIRGLTISGGNADIGGGIYNKATLTVNDCVLRYNTASSGCGIYNEGSGATLTLIGSVVTGHITNGGEGAGIYNSLGTVTIENSTVSDNISAAGNSANAGGVYNGGTMDVRRSTIDGNGAGFTGGGILNNATLTITESTISNNHAGTNIAGSGLGGGIYNRGTLTISNSTLSRNEAVSVEGFGSGGGIFNNALLAIISSTLSGNRANQDGGGICNLGTVQIGNTVLNAGMSGANIFNNAGTVTSRGYNLSSDNGSGFLNGSGDRINTNPMLSPLQGNGGPTLTHKLLVNSPAINAGDPGFTPPPLNDQTGSARVAGGRIDIGSVEVQPTQSTPTPTPTISPSPTTTPPQPTATPSPTSTPSPTATPMPQPTSTPVPTATPAPAAAQLANISTRGLVQAGDNVLIAGFIIEGNNSTRVIIRGIGPSLPVPGALADPTLELHDGNGATMMTNDDWQDDSGFASQLTFFGLALPHPKESGIFFVLQPGAYTAILSGKNGGTGIALVEVYNVH